MASIVKRKYAEGALGAGDKTPMTELCEIHPNEDVGGERSLSEEKINA